MASIFQPATPSLLNTPRLAKTFLGPQFLLVGNHDVQEIDDPAQAKLLSRWMDFSGPEQNTLDHRVSNNPLIDALHVAQAGAE